MFSLFFAWNFKEASVVTGIGLGALSKAFHRIKDLQMENALRKTIMALPTLLNSPLVKVLSMLSPLLHI